MRRLADEYRTHGVSFLGLHGDPAVSSDAVARYASDHGLGFPILAEGQAGLLYPPGLALLLGFGPIPALAAGIVGHALAGSALMFAFCRRLGLSRPAALLARQRPDQDSNLGPTP